MEGEQVFMHNYPAPRSDYGEDVIHNGVYFQSVANDTL